MIRALAAAGEAGAWAPLSGVIPPLTHAAWVDALEEPVSWIAAGFPAPVSHDGTQATLRPFLEMIAAALGLAVWFFVARTVTGFHGESVEALSLGSKCAELNEMIGVHLMIYDLDDLRGALKPDAKGRTPRGDVTAVRRLLEETAP